MKPLVFGHRGASAYAPENTLAAFNLALEQGADGIELDVAVTKDGVPVVIHDDTVDRTTSGHGNIRQLTLDQVKQLDAGSWFDDKYRGKPVRIPTLAEALECVGGRGKVIVEIKRIANEFKNDGRERIIMQVIQQARIPSDRILVSSFHPVALHWASQADPHIPRAFIYHTKILPWLVQRRTFRQLAQPHELHINEEMATQEYVEWAKRQGYGVIVYHPDEIAEMRRILALGVDGIMSNKPDLLRQVVDEYYSESRGP